MARPMWSSDPRKPGCDAMQSLSRGTAMRRMIQTLMAIPLALAGALIATSAYAHFVPAPCDFITGGGWVIDDNGAQVNFGAHGGCKNGAFWGHVNVVHHGFNPPAHLKSTTIAGANRGRNVRRVANSVVKARGRERVAAGS